LPFDVYNLETYDFFTPKLQPTPMETTPTSATMPRHEFFRLVGTGFGAVLLAQCTTACAKAADEIVQPTSITVDITLKLADTANANLNQKGGYVYINGVVVAQTKDGEFIAVSRKCTHDNGAFNTDLIYQQTNNRFYCPNHGSGFDTTGKVLNGPADKSLTQYKVSQDKTTNTIRVFS
jgi:cytochrome b6-f complex iron-sulfur subunit